MANGNSKKPAAAGSGPVATGSTVSVPLTGAAPPPSSSAVLDMPNRVLQITLTRKEEVILARLQTRRTEQGARPSDCTKSRVIALALDKLAQSEGITAD